MAELHFLRPWWLAALPVGIALILYMFKVQARGGAWSAVVDRALQPLVLSEADGYSGRRWPLVAALGAWIVASVALAGPAWERLPVPAFRSNEALVVALDLSRSMDAADLAPDRLSRAKLKVLSLLDRRDGGQTGLVVFSAHAFTVAPLTTDTETIASLVAALSTDIMPTPGSRIAAGLEKSAELIRRAGVTDGRILIMTDATPSAADLELARDLRGEGIDIDVLAIGTEEGAPIPERDGGFLTDGRGNVVVPRLDVRALSRLADLGGGRFARLTPDDADLARLEPEAETGAVAEDEEEIRVADVWRDAGLWLAVLLLPLLALGFRRGWVAVVVACVLVPVPPAGAQQAGTAADASSAAESAERGEGGGLADLWQSLWRRHDQRGAAALDDDRPARAAELFDDPEWRAAAHYRAGDFEASAASLVGLDTADAHYNRGTALARSGDLQAAIGAYDRALELDPDHEDARYNRDLLEDLLEESEQEQQAAAGRESSGEQGENASERDESDGDRGDERADDGQSQAGAGQEGEPGEAQRRAQPAPGESTTDGGDDGDDAAADERFAEADAPQQADGDDRDDDGDGENGQARADATESQEAGDDEAAVAADDLERWASDQAAEQWLRRIQQDPGGLLRRKFLYQYQRLGVDQDGNYVYPENEEEQW